MLVTYNRPDDVVASVRAAVSQDRAFAGLLVVDNSTRESDAQTICQRIASAHGVEIEWHRLGRNTGPAGAISHGMRVVVDRLDDDELDRTWVALLDDDDPLPARGTLGDLLGVYAEVIADPGDVAGIGITGSRLRPGTGRLQRPTGSQRFADVHQIGNGRLPLYRASVIREVGTFRADLFFGREELEFGLRLERSGYRLLVARELRIRYEVALGKAARRPSMEPPTRSRLAERATHNHTRILVTHRGWRSALTFAVGMVVADLVRLLRALVRGQRGRAVHNLAGTCRAVGTGLARGRLPPNDTTGPQPRATRPGGRNGESSWTCQRAHNP